MDGSARAARPGEAPGGRNKVYPCFLLPLLKTFLLIGVLTQLMNSGCVCGRVA